MLLRWAQLARSFSKTPHRYGNDDDDAAADDNDTETGGKMWSKKKASKNAKLARRTSYSIFEE